MKIDKFFPNREVQGSEKILAEYVQFYRVLRGLAQNKACLVTLVIAYRPDINRHNLLTAAVGENPMFKSFQEEYLGFLSPNDSTKMICEIGQWKDIVWQEQAAQKVYDYCGGHPLITRIFASLACEEGTLKQIDYTRVQETAKEIKSTFRRNEIGNYYREGIWELLRDDEKQVLTLICQNKATGLAESRLPEKLEEALTNLEQFGLVKNENNTFQLTAELFQAWLQRRVG